MKKATRVLGLTAALLLLHPLPRQAAERTTGPWDLPALSQPPRTFPAPDAHADGVKGLYFDALPYKGHPTRVFAWYGCPKVEPGQKVPAVVLLHGGGGTAYDEWVRVWNSHGYAAIAPALEGQSEKPRENNKSPYPRHEFSGPARQAIFEDIDQPVQDHWFFHAIADAILADSLLRSFPEVDAERVGVTGISWGGILTSALAGVDDRLKFAIPVYGCGFLNETPIYSAALAKSGSTDKYLRLWEPANFLPNAHMPMLWVNGANDIHFPLNAFSKSARLAKGESWSCVRIGMKHGHPAGWAPPEIYAFADGVVKGADPLPRFTNHGRHASVAWAAYASSHRIRQAELIYTMEPKDWVKCEWQTMPARVDGAKKQVTARLPDGCRGYFFNLTDDRGLLSSTTMQQLGDEPAK